MQLLFAMAANSLKLKTLALQFPAGSSVIKATLDGRTVPVSLATRDGKRLAVFEPVIELKSGQTLRVACQDRNRCLRKV